MLESRKLILPLFASSSCRVLLTVEFLNSMRETLVETDITFERRQFRNSHYRSF